MPYTAQQYIDDVKLRLSRYDAALSLDDATLEMLVNRSRLDVQMATLQMFPERYAREYTLAGVPVQVPEYNVTVTDSNGSSTKTVWRLALPNDLVHDVVVFYNDAISGTRHMCRKLNKRELYPIMKSGSTTPVPFSPIYCVERDVTTGSNWIFLSIGSTPIQPNEFVIWYLARLPYIQSFNAAQTADLEIRIGYDVQELVVKTTLLKALELLELNSGTQDIAMEIELQIAALESAYQMNIIRTDILLPSRETVNPSEPVPVTGE